MNLTPEALEVLTGVLETQGRRFVVIRGSDHSKLNGRWYDLDDPFVLSRPVGEGGVTFAPTGEVERRNDGMLAAVVRPS